MLTLTNSSDGTVIYVNPAYVVYLQPAYSDLTEIYVAMAERHSRLIVKENAAAVAEQVSGYLASRNCQ